MFEVQFREEEYGATNRRARPDNKAGEGHMGKV